MLEVGSGTGELIATALEMKFDVEAIEKEYLLLKYSGVLWIATPNFESGFSRILQDNDPMWREPYHISYFSYDTFKKVLEEVGFEVVDYEVSQRYNGSMELFAKKVDKR